MGRLIVVDCEAPFGVGAPSVGDMTGFGAVDVNVLKDGYAETFHGTDCAVSLQMWPQVAIFVRWKLGSDSSKTT